MAVGVASPAVGYDSAANSGRSREEGAAPAEEGVLGMRVEGKRVAAPVDGAPAEIAVEGDESEEEADEEEEDEEEDDDDDEEEEEEKWVGQYSSTQSILLVGDGDFSFSLALATGFGSGANLVATSLDTYGRIPSPLGRISSTSLLAPQGYPRYEERIMAEPQGNTDDYFACEYRRSLLREYGIKRQLMPEGTSLNYSDFLEARQWESVQRQERLRRMIAAYGSQWDRRPDSIVW